LAADRKSGKFFLHARNFQEKNGTVKKNSIEVFSLLTEKFGKYFFVCEKISQKTFSTKTVHALTRKPELFPNTQKPKFSDVIAITAYQGHLQPDSPKNPGYNKCQKKMPSKARYIAR